jgi:hypothetical protein
LNRLQDFVDRIEVIFAWSQFLRDSRVDLPGRDVLDDLVKGKEHVFGGKGWAVRREKRRDSTALSAAVNYGPFIKALGWIQPAPKWPGAFVSADKIKAAISALENRLGEHLEHPAFSKLGPVTVTAKEVKNWSKAFSLEFLSAQEKAAMRESLMGSSARKELKQTCETIAFLVKRRGGDIDEEAIRTDLCYGSGSHPDDARFDSVRTIWKLLQVRQLFRLALESLLQWLLIQLSSHPAQTSELARAFISETGRASTTKEWLSVTGPKKMSIPERIRSLENAVSRKDAPLAKAIQMAIAVSLAEARESPNNERNDRLPLKRAQQEAKSFETQKPVEFVSHVLNSWVMGQHLYWAVGRGLADARSNGRRILRLKVVPEEAGLTLAPGAGPNFSNPPAATEDRLGTLLSLMRESGTLS